MKNISIAVPGQGALISSIVRLFKIFREANEYELQRARPIPFCVNFVADEKVVNLYGGRYTLKPGQQIKDISKTDLVIIPAMAGNIGEEIQKDKGLQRWITKQYQHGAEIACLCTAVFLLPATGLLQKRHCIKKWFVSNDFRQQFSQVNLIVENAVMDEQEIHTNGGAYSFIDEIIKTESCSDTATTCKAIFEGEFNRECQSLAVLMSGRQKYQQRENKENIRQVVGDPFYTASAVDFTAMLNLNPDNHVDKILYDYLMKAHNSPNEIDCSLNFEINDETNGKAYNNRKVFRQMLGKINNELG